MMRKLRGKLVALFLVATLAPLGLTLWLASRLLDQSLNLAPVNELYDAAGMLERSGKSIYATARQLLREKARAGAAERVAADTKLDPGETERFWIEGEDLFLLNADGKYKLRLEGVSLSAIQAEVAKSRALVEAHRERDYRRGFSLTLALSAGAIWLAALGALLYFTGRVTRPIVRLTEALRHFGRGKRVPLPVESADEVGEAIASFNEMSAEMERSREKLLLVTRLESWQTLGRKMAHEVKNSLTPIRLTVEEMVARSTGQEKAFLEQAAQIVTEEVQTLERRVRAFSDLASEPPLELDVIDLRQLVEERIHFLMTAHPEVIYRKHWDARPFGATADADLCKGILTNLLENAADAVGRGGVIKVSLRESGAFSEVLVEDSGPGLSLLAKETLFQPTISFKRTGMGLGLSIAKRSAITMGGDLELVESSLGGAAFVLRVPKAEIQNPTWQNESSSSTTKKTLAAPYA
jgi:nitrogen fixation/metabolism regulation signal transduction histidine kinase